jgi:hypothetical protein
VANPRAGSLLDLAKFKIVRPKVKIKWFGLLRLSSRWVRFSSWWNFNSIKVGWRAVGMYLIGRRMFFSDKGRTIRVTVAGLGVLYLVPRK